MPDQMKQNGEVRDTYFELVNEFPLVSIRSSRELKAARKMIDSLLAREPLNEGEEIYLDALSDLVAVYEDEEFEIHPPSDAGLLAHLLEAKQITQSDLAEALCISKSTICEVLSGKRELTRQQIMLMSNYFNIEPAAFLQKSRKCD
ncbi:MAG TPA: helix-turn-helix domain-containing protein [Pirellulales bacterium]|jgi:HTH-type transcriptional regulator/antitoxin HigA|nr:helix-turn-helix domain-containing protein [Pirellulales bacterium]